MVQQTHKLRHITQQHSAHRTTIKLNITYISNIHTEYGQERITSTKNFMQNSTESIGKINYTEEPSIALLTCASIEVCICANIRCNQLSSDEPAVGPAFSAVCLNKKQ